MLYDDNVAADMGFVKQPHHNIKIKSIPTFGYMKHWGIIGNKTIIKLRYIQVMSAGSDFNYAKMKANHD